MLLLVPRGVNEVLLIILTLGHRLVVALSGSGWRVESGGRSRRVGRLARMRSFDKHPRPRGYWLSNILVHLRQPKWHEVNSLGHQSGTTVDEFGKLWHRLDQVRVDQVSNPLRWLLANLCRELDLENTIREQLLLRRANLMEWVVDAEIGSAPIAVGTVVAVKVVLADHGELSVEGDTDAGVSGELECGSVVERSHD